jgi:hypothetical protein
VGLLFSGSAVLLVLENLQVEEPDDDESCPDGSECG